MLAFQLRHQPRALALHAVQRLPGIVHHGLRRIGGAAVRAAGDADRIEDAIDGVEDALRLLGVGQPLHRVLVADARQALRGGVAADDKPGENAENRGFRVHRSHPRE